MGLDYAEAADELGVPLNTFKSQLLRGTKLLREALSDRLEPAPASTFPAIAATQAEPVALGGNGRHAGELRVSSEQPARALNVRRHRAGYSAAATFCPARVMYVM